MVVRTLQTAGKASSTTADEQTDKSSKLDYGEETVTHISIFYMILLR